LTIRKINRNQVAAKELPSRFFRELVSHRVLKSKGIALRVVDVLPAKQAGPRHPHSHPGMEEVIYVENGSGKAWVNGETAKIVRGDTILIPAGFLRRRPGEPLQRISRHQLRRIVGEFLWQTSALSVSVSWEAAW